MDFSATQIIPILPSHVEAIIAWKYEGDLALYNLDQTEETKQNFLNHDYYVMVNQHGEVIGFYCYGVEAQIPYGNIYHAYDDQSYTDIGIGMNPRYIGKGYGYPFFMRGLDFLTSCLNTSKFRLSVLDHNLRARKLYHRAGFRVQAIFPANLPNRHFIVMIKE